ncbi:thioesterase family protein [uncultured Polaribacter sp.]|uniref:thioesterase family protein n=1 Tax=uncultured Polaribacter sp. TaxID=174711 RepID=UPI00259B231D|nr:thioesterase family protein [uncultured Polaribacter sp.]
MFQRTYTVKGEDVNDFMVMENAAYLKYTSKLVETFLFVNHFTKLKMNSLKVGLQKKNDQIQQYKYLMFTQPFLVELNCKELGLCDQKMKVEISFYNQQKELCALVTRELFWFDYTKWETVIAPKTIRRHFIEEKTYKKVS